MAPDLKEKGYQRCKNIATPNSKYPLISSTESKKTGEKRFKEQLCEDDCSPMNLMKTLVMKFGGAAVATPDHFSLIADLIIKRMEHYPRVIIVVSAMGKTTDQLIELARQVPSQSTQPGIRYVS